MTIARGRGKAQGASAFRLPVRVYWEDTDAAGIVFYANYLKFFERARTEWLRSLGFDQERLRAETRIAFVVAETALRYRLPARRRLRGRGHDSRRLCRARNFPAAPRP